MKHSKVVSVFCCVLMSVVVFPLTGCGPSQEDLMMRAARRQRPKDAGDIEDEKREKSKSTKPAPSEPKPNEEETLVAAAGKAEPPLAEVVEDKPELVEMSFPPIEERKPATPLSEAERRRQSLENITKLADALQKFYIDKKRFPQSFQVSRSKIPTLSWRVEILPYLGYQDLYDQFDFTMPWDREPNKSLLSYIPPEFVSPERFDTKTNYLLPADRAFMFGENRSPRIRDVDDGVDNTIMMVEVNDDLAVEWTSPRDYIPKNKTKMSRELGGLRGDGCFAVWANGWLTLLAGGLNDTQLFNAFTYESGDGQQAGDVHRSITIAEVSEASTAASHQSTVNEAPASSVENMPTIEQPAVVREAVPIGSQVAAAQDKLRKLFAKKIAEAREDDEKTDLAKEMLEEAADMSEDPAGAFALQTAALRLAVDAAEAETMLEGVDQRVGRFEVDAFEENVTWLMAFGQSAVERDAESVDGEELMRRAVHVVYAGIADNDFVRASAVARIAYRYTGQERTEQIPKLFNRLRILLSSAKREYEKAHIHLADYRLNPADNEAGAAFGRFLCFIKGDWAAGLPLIADGENKDLREMAKADMAGADDYLNQVGLGDAWWDLGARARSGVYRQAARDRAVYWYKMAYEVMPESLDRLHVKSRLDEEESTDGASPIALTMQLADELGVDLEESLAAIADVGQQKKRRRDRDED